MSEAVLGFVVDSSQAASAAVDLDKLVTAATKTETSVEKLGRSSKRALADAGAGTSEFSRKVQSAIQQSENLGRTFGAQDDHVRAFRAEVERLTMKYQPLAKATRDYEATINEIGRAHRMGIINAQQMTQRLDQERFAFERLKTSAEIAGAAVMAANTNVPRGTGQNFAAGNAMFQFQDIAMTAAMGMDPRMIGLQQGSQLAGAYAGMGLKQAAATTGAALVGLLSPLSLVTVGLTTATAMAIQYFATSSEGADDMAIDLERQRDLIMEVAARWGDALPALKAYANELDQQREAQEKQDAVNSAAALKIKGLRSEWDDLITTMGRMDANNGLSNVMNSADTEKLAAFREGMTGVSEAIAAGKDPTEDLNSAVASLASIMQNNANPVLTQFSGVLDGFANKMRDGAAAARDLRDSFKPLSAPWSEGGRIFHEEDFIPRNPATPSKRPNIELSGDPADSAMSPALANLLKGNYSSLTESANVYSAAIKGVETASTGAVNATQSLAMAQTQQLMAMQQSSAQLRSMQKELTDVNAALKAAANFPLSEIFGDFAGREEADALANARASLEKIMDAFKAGGSSAKMAHDGIELVRQSLKGVGGEASAVDRLIDSFVAGSTVARQLKANIDQLSQSIMVIPDKLVNIGIRQYTVPSSGGGTANVNVIGGGNIYGESAPDITSTQYDVGGGKMIGVHEGHTYFATSQQYAQITPEGRERIYRGQSDYLKELSRKPTGMVTQDEINSMYSLQGYRAAGGPVSAGGTYMVGEQGPEIVTFPGSGYVTNANMTASILSGGRDMLSLIEDHGYDILAELRVHTRYWETNDDDNNEIIACLKKLESYGGSSSYSGSSRSSSSGSSYSGSSGSSDSGNDVRDPYSPYYFNAARNNAGRGGGRYDPIADALMNGNTEALRNLSGGPTAGISRALAGHNMPSLLDRLKKQAGFATGGQIMPGEDQKVEFFKRRKERVIIVDNDNVSDQRGASQQSAPQALPPIQITNYFQGDVGDARSRQSMEDQFRRAVQQAVRR